MNSTICDAYSQGCVTPPPELPSTAPTPPSVSELPTTGIMVGDLILLAILLLLLGIATVMLVKKTRGRHE